MAKITLNDLTSNYGSQALHNANNDTIEDNLNNKVLYRDNPDGEPNSMQQELDMNSNRIINMADGVNNTDAVSVSQLNALVAGTGNVSNVIQARESQLGSQAVARVFTLSGIVYALGVNTLAVYRNGQRLEKSVDYLESSASTVTLTFDPNANDRFVFITNALSTSVAGTTDAITHTEDSSTYNLATYLQNRHVINVKDYGAVGDGVTDDSAAIQAAINAGPSAILQAGTYSVDSMIEIGFDQSLYLAPGVKLLRRAATSSSTDPVIWIKGNNAVLQGGGWSLTEVKTENRCPKGVVRIGHKDMTESHANVNYTFFSDMRVFGPIDGGQTSGNPDVCVYRANPSIGSNIDSYFATIQNIRVNSANIGFQWQGDANGDKVDNVQGQNIGNATLSSDRVMFSLEGCADHAFSNAFFHQSTDSTMIRVIRLDNSGTPGGKNHGAPDANALINMVGEQGGSGVWLEATDVSGVAVGQRNIVHGIDNGGGGFSIGDDFLKRNHVNNGDGLWQRRRLQIGGTTGETNTALTIVADQPELIFNEQDASADNKQWEIYPASEQLIGRVVNDANNSAANFLTIDRAGASVDNVSLATGGSGNTVLQVDTSGTAGDTRLLLWDVSAGSLVRVTRGAADSAGSGFRVLRIPN